MAHSLATFEPTRSMRLLGLLGVAGAVLLLWAFVAWNPFADRFVNALRLILFWLGGLAIALAFHRRQSEPGSALATLATGLVVAANAWNVAWVVLSIGRDSPFSGLFGELGFVASLVGWHGAAFYGGATLWLGRA